MSKVIVASNAHQEDLSANHGHGRNHQRRRYTTEDLRISCQQHAENVREALYRYGPPSGMPLRRSLNMISHRTARELRYVNPHARWWWLHYLRDAYQQWDIEAAPNLRMITLINGAWHFGEGAWDLDLNRIKRQIRAILAGYNYVVAIEFACFRNYVMADNTGRIIAPHVQGLIWRETPGLPARCAQLGAGLASADPLRLLAIREAAGGFYGAVGYMVKPPHHGYCLWQDRSGRFHHRGEKLALKRHYRLFTHLLPYDYPDLTLSGGEGVAVLRTARAAADRPFRRSQR